MLGGMVSEVYVSSHETEQECFSRARKEAGAFEKVVWREVGVVSTYVKLSGYISSHNEANSGRATARSVRPPRPSQRCPLEPSVFQQNHFVRSFTRWVFRIQ